MIEYPISLFTSNDIKASNDDVFGNKVKVEDTVVTEQTTNTNTNEEIKPQA